MFGVVATIISSFVLFGNIIKGDIKTDISKCNAIKDGKDFFFDNNGTLRSVSSNEPVFYYAEREHNKVIGAKTGRIYRDNKSENERFIKQERNYDELNSFLKQSGQNIEWKHNSNWDHAGKNCKKIFGWGQIDTYNGKYINDIFPVSNGYEILYANENNYGVRLISMDGCDKIDYRIISCDEYKKHYMNFRKNNI